MRIIKFNFKHVGVIYWKTYCFIKYISIEENTIINKHINYKFYKFITNPRLI